MDQERGIVEFLCEGGSGAEATVRVELRTEFPGLGGTLITQEGVVAALREDYNTAPRTGHLMFVRHAVIKKLDDYFFRTGEYVFAHIPRPLGSISRPGGRPYEAYLYEWVFGSEYFPWTVQDRGGAHTITLRDWNSFVRCFKGVGIDMGRDCVAEDTDLAQNIVHHFPNSYNDRYEMSSTWKRIDFGSSSIGMDYGRLVTFLVEHEDGLVRVLRQERYEMLQLAVAYLKAPEAMREIDIGRLETYLGDYRRATLTQYTMGFGPRGAPIHGPRTESLVDD